MTPFGEGAQHPEDDLELYALGMLDEVSAARIEAHVRRCAQCSTRLADAQTTVAALATPKKTQTPDPALRTRVLATAFSRTAAPTGAWSALAAAFIVGVGLTIAGLLPALMGTRGSMHANDVALSTIVSSHFNHAAFRPLQHGAPQAKVLYGRHGEWLYIVIHSRRADLRATAFTGAGSRRELPRPTIQGNNQTLFIPNAHRPARIEIGAGNGVLEEVSPVYSR